MLKGRLQVLIRPDQRRRLEAEAKRRHTSVATLVREAVDARYGAITVDQRGAAVEAIRALRGAFIPPAQLDDIGEHERDETATDTLNARR